MLFSLATAVMVILVSVFWVYQGFFSSLLFFFESVIALMAAFGFYESLNGLWAESLGSGVGLPLALMLIFLVVLLVLRLFTDMTIKGNVRLPMVADRIGGGAFGLLTGMVLVGTALTAIQMIPMGSSVFGFERMAVSPTDGTVTRKSLMLKPDDFTVGLVSMLSSGRFGGDNSFAQTRPDFINDLYNERNSTQTEDNHYPPATAVQVLSYWDARQIDQVTQKADGEKLSREFETKEPGVGKKFIVCKIHLDTIAAAKDSPDIRFRTTQFRLVGPPPAKEGETVSSSRQVFAACGLSDLYTHKQHKLNEVSRTQAARLVRFNPDTDFSVGPGTTKVVADPPGETPKAYKFDVAFEVPEDFTPWYLEFKRGARVELAKKTERKEPPSDGAKAFGPAAPKVGSPDSGGGSGGKKSDKKSNDNKSNDDKGSDEKKVGEAPAGRVNVSNAVEERTGATTLLPVFLDKREKMVSNALKGGKLAECNFWVELSDDEVPAASQVKDFLEPEEKKVVQIGAEQNMPLSLFGRALNYAANVVAQITVTDSNGKNYFAVGVYSEATIGGKRFFEIQYWPDAEAPDRQGLLQKPKKLTKDIMERSKPSDRKFGYIFLVDPGVKLVSFAAGKQGNKQKLNIQVPK